MYHYKVVKNSLLTPTVRSVVLRAEDNTSFLFEPGQYVAISMRHQWRPTTTRCFSIASSPTDRHSVEICARVKGKYTTEMEQLVPGDKIDLRGPFGHFVFNEEIHKRLVLFAGGIGITPFMSMIRYAASLRLPNHIHLVYSCRHEGDIPFLEELLKIEEDNPNFHLTFVIGSGEVERLKNRNVITGKIKGDHLLNLGLKFSEDTYMICGPTGYIQSIQFLLTSHGIPKERVLSEAFGQGNNQPSERMKPWPLNMYALAGLSFSLAMFFITASDLLKTLPTLKEDTATTSTTTNKTKDLAAIKPQVDTNISQKPIIRYVAGTNPTAPKIVTPPPPTVVKTPTPTPPPVTVTPTTRPKTRVS